MMMHGLANVKFINAKQAGEYLFIQKHQTKTAQENSSHLVQQDMQGNGTEAEFYPHKDKR